MVIPLFEQARKDAEAADDARRRGDPLGPDKPTPQNRMLLRSGKIPGPPPRFRIVLSSAGRPEERLEERGGNLLHIAAPSAFPGATRDVRPYGRRQNYPPLREKWVFRVTLYIMIRRHGH